MHACFIRCSRCLCCIRAKAESEAAPELEACDCDPASDDAGALKCCPGSHPCKPRGSGIRKLSNMSMTHYCVVTAFLASCAQSQDLRYNYCFIRGTVGSQAHNVGA